jgi:hypothetical protein
LLRSKKMKKFKGLFYGLTALSTALLIIFALSCSSPTGGGGGGGGDDEEDIPTTFTVSGVISGSDGQPIAGGTVKVLNAADDSVVGTPVTIGADGSYSIPDLPAGTYKLVIAPATPGEYETKTIGPFSLPGSNPVVPALGKYYDLTGTITGSDSGDMSGTAVALFKEDFSPAGTATVADSSGAYTISSVLPGKYTIVASRASYETTPSLFFTVPDDIPRNLTLAAGSGYAITGKITGPNGAPADGVSVQLKLSGADSGSPVSTDTDGIYIIHVASDASYTLTVTKTDYEQTGTPPFVLSGTGAKLTHDLSLVEGTGHTIVGTILKTGGGESGAAAGALIKLKDSGNALVGEPVNAGSNGYYSIPHVEPGTYTIEVSLAGFETGTSAGFTVPDVLGADLTLEKTKYTLTGTITKKDRESDPVESETTADGASVQLKYGNQNIGSAVTAAPDGTYTIPDVYAGMYTIQVSLTDYDTKSSTLFTVPDSLTRDLTLIKTSYELTGTITQNGGAGLGIPLAGATIQLKEGTDNAAGAVTTAADGTYSIPGILPGTYTIEVSKTNYVSGTSSSFVVPTALINDLTLEEVSYTVTGTVYKSDNSGASDVSIYLKKEDTVVSTVKSGTGGTYSIPGVYAGDYTINAQYSGHYLFISSSFPVPANSTQDIHLQASTSSAPQGIPTFLLKAAAFEPIDFTAALADEAYTETTTNLSGVISLRWSEVNGATSYKLHYDRARVFSNPTPNSNSETGLYYWPGDIIPEGSTAISPTFPPVTATTVTVTDPFYFARDLDAQTVYIFWLQACNASGDGPMGQPNQQYLGGAGRQSNGGVERADYPKSVTAIPGDGTILVSWEKSDRAVWYEVFYHTENLTWTQIGEGGPDNLKPYKKIALQTTQNAIPWNQPWNDSTGALGSNGTPGGDTAYPIYRFNVTITGLTNGTPYYIWIRSLNSNGERGLAKVSAVTPSVPLNPVSGLSAVEGPGKLDLSWNPVPGATNYGVYWSTGNDLPSIGSYHVTTTEVSYALLGLEGTTAYSVWVIPYSGSVPGAFSLPIRKTTLPRPSVVDNTKLDKNGHKVENFLYVEVNDNDPRVAMGYVMEQSNKQFFDYVVIFAANLRTRDCEAEYFAGGANHICTKKGPHLHYNGNVQHILDNRDKYIKPLQDRGIKVLLGLLGDHDPIGMGTFETPANSKFPASTNEARETLMAEIASEVNRLGLDGIDFDDEWSETNDKTAMPYNATSGNNMARFIVSARRHLGPDKTISVFEWHSARFLPKNIEVWLKDGKYYPEDPGDATSETKPLADFYDIITEASYGSWVEWGYNGSGGPANNSTAAAHPTTKYAPIGINVDTMNPSWNNINSRTGTGGSYFMSPSHNGSAGGSNWYGFNMWYALRHRAWYQTSGTWGAAGSPRTIEGYLSRASQNIYGENVIYVGNDYPQDWSKW